MKKVLVVVLSLVLLALLAGGAFVAYSYFSVSAEEVTPPQVTVHGAPLRPTFFRWNQPILGGMLHEEITSGDIGAATDLGAVEDGALRIEAPADYETHAALAREGVAVFSGGLDAYSDALIETPGSYTLTLRCTATGEADGFFEYAAEFTVPQPPEEPWPDEPVFEPGRDVLEQGDVFSMQLRYLPEGLAPTAQSELGLAIFTPLEAGLWRCTLPVGNTRAPGEYTVTVAADEFEWQHTITVLPFAFVEQDLTIDVTDPVISESNSAEAYQQYRDTIPPLFETWDEESYWEGMFIAPAEGRVSTEFGTIRYTNGDYANPGIHTGMDIAAAEGTPVYAPNNGRVVLAEYLLNTGNTLVIEYGGGLKSYFFHMYELNVEAGQMVAKGDLVGAVGTTGYSTGPHLHYELRIGNQAINPSMLLDPGAGLYALLSEEQKDRTA